MLKTIVKVLAVWLAAMCLLFFFLAIGGDI
jgi:hypothetical protein